MKEHIFRRKSTINEYQYVNTQLNISLLASVFNL